MSNIESIPNIGPAIAAKLHRLGIQESDQLRSADAVSLYKELCAIDRRQHDPCLLDVFMSAVSYLNGEPVKHWWEYTPIRKKMFPEGLSGPH